MTRLSSLVFPVLLCLASAAFAQRFYEFPFEVEPDGIHVKDRYYIQFQPRREGEMPVVWPPNPGNHPPCCLHSSGQSYADVEAALNLDGHVLAIADLRNGVFVHMSAAEADRLRADPRVLRIDQDILLTADDLTFTYPTSAQYAASAVPFRANPELFRSDRYSLQLASVDYNGMPGVYQDATIEYFPQDKSWRLNTFNEAVPIAEIAQVDLVVTAEKPAQVFLKVNGKFPNGCPQVGQVGLRQDGRAFNVYLYYQHGTNLPGRMCTQAEVPFSRIVPLPVYGLLAGTYTYMVNGKFGGSFTLATNNVLE